MPNYRKQEHIVVEEKAKSFSPFTKFLLVVLFVALPAAGFWFGAQQPTESTIPPTPEETVPAADPISNATSSNQTTENTVPETPPEPQTETQTPVATPTPAPAPTPQYTAPAPTIPTGPRNLTVYITAATSDLLTVDQITIYEDDEAIAKMISDDLCPADEPKKCRLEGGVYYRNVDPSVMTYALSQEVEVLTWTGTKYPLSRIKNHPGNNTPYTITINPAGVVTKIQEIYRP